MKQRLLKRGGGKGGCRSIGERKMKMFTGIKALYNLQFVERERELV